MKRYTVIGLAVLALVVSVRLTLPYTGNNILVDILPSFAGYLLIFFGTEKLPYNNTFLRKVLNVSVILSLITFIGAAAQLYPYYLTEIFKNDAGSSKFFATLIKVIGDGYSDSVYLFYGIGMLYLALVMIAFSTEMRYRVSDAKESEEFSHKNVYGEVRYSRKAYKLYNAVCICCAVIFAAEGIIYIVNNFLNDKIVLDLIGFEIQLSTMLIPVGIAFCPFAGTMVNMLSDKRRGDRLKEKSDV